MTTPGRRRLRIVNVRSEAGQVARKPKVVLARKTRGREDRGPERRYLTDGGTRGLAIRRPS